MLLILTLKVGLIFLLIVLLMKEKWPLGCSMLVGAGLLGVSFGMGVGEILRKIISTFLSFPCLELMSILILILVFSHILRGTGQIDRLMDSMKTFVKDTRIITAFFPAMIGLLPMLGGALFSAPLVEDAGRGLRLTPVKKTLVNYWFRHLWEYCWPLYPGIVLASKLVKIDLPKLVLLQLPLTLAAILAGILFVFRGVGRETSVKIHLERNPKRKVRFLMEASPLVIVILLVLILKVNLAVALILSILATLLINRVSAKETVNMVRKGLSWKVAVAAIGVMAFKNLLEEVGAVTAITSSLRESNIIPLVMIITLPFLVGLFTGITLGPVGIVFPVLLPFFQNSSHNFSYIILAFACGFAGVLFSPVHLCLILTKDYFKAQWNKIYRGLLLPVGFVMLVAVVLFLSYGG